MIDEPSTEGRAGRARYAVAAVAGLAVIALVAGVAVVVRSGSDSEGVVEGGRFLARTGVTETPGLRPRLSATQAVVGDRLFLYGGKDPQLALRKGGLLADSALVDPKTGDVEALPAAPFDVPLWDATAIALPGEVFLLGRLCAIGPRYDPETAPSDPDCRSGTYAAATLDLTRRVWASVTIPASVQGVRGADAIVRGLGATSDGRVVVGLGSYLAPQPWTYDAATHEWVKVPDSGVSVKDGCLADDRLVVLTTKYQHNGKVVAENPAMIAAPGETTVGYEGDGYVEPAVAIWDLAAGGPWRISEVAPGVRFTDMPPRLVCMGREAMAVSRLNPMESLALFDLTTGGARLPSKPPFGSVFDGELWSGSELIFRPLPLEAGASALAYDPASDRWRALVGMPAVTTGALWSGAAMVGYSEATSWHEPYEFKGPPPLPRPTTNRTGVFHYVPREG